MLMLDEKFLEKIRDGQLLFGFGLRYYDPGIIEQIGAAPDFIWLDLQHGTIQQQHLPDLIRTADLVGTAVLPRLPGHNPQVISNILDLDPGGVIVPQVETAEQARALAQAAKMPPLGERSFGGRRMVDRHGRDYLAQANRRQCLIVQLESPAAVDNADAIAAVDGVDGLMIGPDDFSLRHSRSGSMPPTWRLPATAEAETRIAAAARRHGKFCLTFAGTREEIVTARDKGFQLLDVGADVIFLREGLNRRLELIQIFR